MLAPIAVNGVGGDAGSDVLGRETMQRRYYWPPSYLNDTRSFVR